MNTKPKMADAMRSSYGAKHINNGKFIEDLARWH